MSLDDNVSDDPAAIFADLINAIDHIFDADPATSRMLDGLVGIYDDWKRNGHISDRAFSQWQASLPKSSNIPVHEKRLQALKANSRQSGLLASSSQSLQREADDDLRAVERYGAGEPTGALSGRIGTDLLPPTVSVMELPVSAAKEWHAAAIALIEGTTTAKRCVDLLPPMMLAYFEGGAEGMRSRATEMGCNVDVVGEILPIAAMERIKAEIADYVESLDEEERPAEAKAYVVDIARYMARALLNNAIVTASVHLAEAARECDGAAKVAMERVAGMLEREIELKHHVVTPTDSQTTKKQRKKSAAVNKQQMVIGYLRSNREWLGRSQKELSQHLEGISEATISRAMDSVEGRALKQEYIASIPPISCK